KGTPSLVDQHRVCLPSSFYPCLCVKQFRLLLQMAAASGGGVAAAVLPEGTMQRLTDGARASDAASRQLLNDENRCKWKKLALLADAGEYAQVATCTSWNDANIPLRIKRALDEAWTIEKARMA